jgi:cardiolipin synthase
MELLHEPKTALARRIQLLENTQDEIQVQVFKLCLHPFAETFLKILIDKAQAGVKVSLLTDAFYGKLPSEWRSKLEKAGVCVKLSRKFQLLPWKNLERMHDKLLIIDRKSVLTGGRNLEPAAFDLDPKKKLLDLEICLEGIAAEVAASYFDQCWQEAHAANDFGFHVRHKNFVFLGGRDPARELYKALAVAEEEIILCSPYFVPSRKLFSALAAARANHVRIRVFTNSAKSSDQALAHAAYLNSRSRLLRAGVEVIESSGHSVLHAKCALIDKSWAFIGSFNFDPRSENLNSESMFGIQEPKLCSEVLEKLEAFTAAQKNSANSSPRPLLATVLRPLAGLPFVRAQL